MPRPVLVVLPAYAISAIETTGFRTKDQINSAESNAMSVSKCLVIFSIIIFTTSRSYRSSSSLTISTFQKSF
jgi:hypothetical protein